MRIYTCGPTVYDDAHVGHARAALALADGGRRWRRVLTTWSYASSSDPRLVFGLGDRSGDPREPAKIVVEWPDGQREEFDEVAAGAYTTLRQGSGRPAAEADG